MAPAGGICASPGTCSSILIESPVKTTGPCVYMDILLLVNKHQFDSVNF